MAVIATLPESVPPDLDWPSVGSQVQHFLHCQLSPISDEMWQSLQQTLNSFNH